MQNINEFPVCVHQLNTLTKQYGLMRLIMVHASSEVRIVIQLGVSHSLQSCSHPMTCQSSVDFTTIYI